MLKKLIGNKVSSVVMGKKYLLLGAILALGGLGLLLSGIGYGVSLLFLTYTDLTMLSALVAGFFSTAFFLLAVGVGCILKK